MSLHLNFYLFVCCSLLTAGFFSPRGHLNECLVTPAEFLREKHPASSVLCLVVVVVVVVVVCLFVLLIGWLVS